MFVGASDAAAQTRRPCVNQDSPKGCVGFNQGPQRGGVPDPDRKGIVPLTDTPLAKALRAPDEWQPPPDATKEGTVTVSPASPAEQKPAEENPAPEAAGAPR